MKKVIKILFSLIIVFLICIGSVNMSFATVKQDQQRASSKYHQLLKGKSGYYAIVDINGDNVKDLLWKDTDSFCCKIYTYRYGKLKCIKNFSYGKGANMYYNTGEKSLIIDICYSSAHDISIYQVKQSSVNRIKHFEDYRYFNKNGVRKFNYKINGKRVSKSTYNKSLSYAKRGCKQVTRTI